MSSSSSIEWLARREPTGTITRGATWNPVTGCTEVSPGCDHCYARTFAERFRGVPGHPYEQGFDLRLWPERLGLPLLWKKPRRIFVNSMSDLFNKDVPDDFIVNVFRVMSIAHQHTYMVLTKRPSRLVNTSLLAQIEQAIGPWPAHIRYGVSVESVDYLWRIRLLRRVLAPVRFLSCEPLLGPIPALPLEGIHWVITGGESGPHARPCDPEWVRAIRDQCLAAGVAFFHKQWGGRHSRAEGRTLDGIVWSEDPEEVAHGR